MTVLVRLAAVTDPGAFAIEVYTPTVVLRSCDVLI